jgi:acetyl-CoA C-acetyltransferase
MAQQDIVIVAAARTAVGKFGGTLAKVAAPELGATVLKALLQRSGLSSEQIGEVILGQVLTAGSAKFKPIEPAPGRYVRAKA